MCDNSFLNAENSVKQATSFAIKGHEKTIEFYVPLRHWLNRPICEEPK
jgi:hypothetical protein